MVNVGKYTSPMDPSWLTASDLRKLGVHRDRFRLGECGAHFAQSLEEILPVFQRKIILRKTHSFRGNLPEIRVGKNGTSKYGVFLKWWQPTTIGFPTKNDHFGGFGGKTPFEETPICQPISRKKSGRRWCEPLQTNDLWDSTAPKAVSYETNPCWIWYWWDMSQKGPKIGCVWIEMQRNERFLVFFGSPILSHLLTPDIILYIHGNAVYNDSGSFGLDSWANS